MDKLFLVAIGGVFGSVSRYLLTSITQRLIGSTFPYGTVIVNLLGSFLFGFIWGVLESRVAWTAELRLLVLTGFMGSLTTFSTFTMEGLALLQSAQWLQASLYIAGQVCAGILLVALGMYTGRLL